MLVEEKEKKSKMMKRKGNEWELEGKKKEK